MLALHVKTMRKCSIIPLALFCPLLLAGCLNFQQGPVQLYGTKNFVTIGAEKIYLEEHGSTGTPLLLVHGFGASHTSWAAVLPGLSRQRKVLVIDLPGHGFSDKYAGDYSLRALARKVLQVLDRKGVKQVHLVGHSWGTAICLTLARMAPQRIKSMTLIASFAYEQQVPPYMVWARAPGLGEFLFSMMWSNRIDDRLNYAFYDADRFATPEMADRARETFKRPGVLAAALAAARGIRFDDLQPHYRKMKTQALIISGEHDRVTRLPAARRLAADLPNARHLVLPLCGHLPIVEHPAKVVRAVLGFLREVEQRETRNKEPGTRNVERQAQPHEDIEPSSPMKNVPPPAPASLPSEARP